MKYQVGDEIVVLYSSDEGRVIEIMNDKMVLIEVKGVKFPAYMDQIDFPYFQRFSKKKEVAVEKKPKVYVDQVQKEKRRDEVKVSDGIWLALFPKFDLDVFGDDIVEKFKVYIINRTDLAYEFTYKMNYFGKPDFEITSDIHPFKDFYLHDVNFENLNDNPSFDFEFSLLTPDKHKADYCEATFKIKAKQLFQHIEKLKQNNEPSLNYLLLEKYPNKAYDESGLDLSKLSGAGYKVYDAKNARQHLPPARSVVDLHIEKLSDNWENLGNFEILTIQLQEVEKWLDLAISHRLPDMVIIHGVGKGKLKEEVHDILKVKKEVRSFINQYEASYGYGATQVFFEYK